MLDPVLYVLRWYPTRTETFVYREIQGLLEAGQPVIVAAMGSREPGPVPDVEVWKGSLRSLARRARRAGVRRVHAHFEGEASALAQALADRLGVPFSVTVHAAGLFRPRAGIVRRLRRARPVVTVCEHHRAWIERHFGVQSVVVRCGVRPMSVSADPGREPTRVVAVARDVPKKDLDRLRRAHPAVEILSTASQQAVQEALLRAQIFALPCRVGPRGGRDGVPVAMLEAMAVGLPVVTRPVAGVGELVDASVGWIGPDFEAGLAAALEAPEDRCRRGSAARERVRRSWTVEGSVRALTAAWDRVQP